MVPSDGESGTDGYRRGFYSPATMEAAVTVSRARRTGTIAQTLKVAAGSSDVTTAAAAAPPPTRAVAAANLAQARTRNRAAI